MRSIRIGNDITMRWVLTSGGEAYCLAGKDIGVELRDSYGRLCPVEWSVADNVVTATYRGRMQRSAGTYHLTLYENSGGDGMVSVDSCDAFRLVARTPCACGASSSSSSGGCSGAEVEAVSLTFASEVEFAQGYMVDSALSLTSTNPVQNRVVTAALDGKQPTGDYLTEVPEGYVTDGELAEALDAREATAAEVAAIVAAMDI